MVVLRLRHFRESDIWLKVLGKEQGTARLFAFGGAKSRRRFCGCLDIFNTLLCRVRSSKDGKFLYLDEASLLDGPRTLRSDWKRMGMANNCLRFLEAFDISSEYSLESFSLVNDMKATLESRMPVSCLFPFFFRFRFASIMGFAPNLAACAICGKKIENESFFGVDEGQLCCPDCNATYGFSKRYFNFRLSGSGLDLLRAVQQNSPSLWPKDDLSPSIRRVCGQIIDAFIQYHLGLMWENGMYRRV